MSNKQTAYSQSPASSPGTKQAYKESSRPGDYCSPGLGAEELSLSWTSEPSTRLIWTARTNLFDNLFGDLLGNLFGNLFGNQTLPWR